MIQSGRVGGLGVLLDSFLDAFWIVLDAFWTPFWLFLDSLDFWLLMTYDRCIWIHHVSFFSSLLVFVKPCCISIFFSCFWGDSFWDCLFLDPFLHVLFWTALFGSTFLDIFSFLFFSFLVMDMAFRYGVPVLSLVSSWCFRTSWIDCSFLSFVWWVWRSGWEGVGEFRFFFVFWVL